MPSNNKEALSIHNLTVAYEHKPVLWNINLEVPSGELVGIIGPNGAGKSTFLKAILGLTPIASGTVTINGKAFKKLKGQVAYVPQKEEVDWDFPATVKDVVEMGRYGKKSLFSALRKQDHEIVISCLKKVELLDFADRHISELSGGQKQRVFIARALAQEAEIYFMDEPFAGVDAASEKQIVQILLELKKEGKSIFVVHHDLQSAIDYFDWMILINTRLISCGKTEHAFTIENLKQTYGGKLTVLSQLAQLLKHKQFNLREKE